ncbi:MAG: hypothetical protein KDD48_04315, partial [Bdellovibrionales bacterium]|nr:hypothetical protein [Bdellovibrionales bacterium]
LHLTTLFPDVRLKNHLEYRTADATPFDLTIALVAFWVGLLYDEVALNATNDFVEPFTYDDIVQGNHQAAKLGLQGQMKSTTFLELARSLAEISSQGLGRIDQLAGTSQLRFLKPIHDLLEKGQSPAENLIGQGKKVLSMEDFSL